MLVLDWKERAFIEKVNFKCFCYYQAAIVVVQNGAPIWRLHTKLYRGADNIWADNSETIYGPQRPETWTNCSKLVFDNVSFSWLLPLDGFQFILFVAWQWKRSIYDKPKRRDVWETIDRQRETADYSCRVEGKRSKFVVKCFNITIRYAKSVLYGYGIC